ncbi:MAG: hypothetical protein N3D82_05120 [Ignisphaera sp.]|nr:hypothetical protein [Ignisphaera sp.]MCX8168389.1 hypothetical protein [Ignisphaera sp.]MDW8085779.1 hypothetical protein [Ignisphaera sp.]
MPVMYRCSNCGKLLYYYITGFNDDSTGMRSINDIVNLYMGVCPYCRKPLPKNKLNGIDIRAVEQIIEKSKDAKKM